MPEEEERGIIKKPRYNVTLPPDLNAQLQNLANKHHIPIPDLIRRFIKLGIVEDNVGPFVYTDQNGRRIEVEMFPEEDDQKLRLWEEKDDQ